MKLGNAADRLIKNPVIDFAEYIAERTDRFTGRKEVFQAVDHWLADRKGSRYFVIVGEPGSGKTAIAARLLQFSTGEVAPPVHAHALKIDYVSAAHFCSARDRRWANPIVFAESLAQQLAARYPDYAQALTKPKFTRPKEEHLHVKVEQTINQMSDGHVTGAWIEKLDLSGLSVDDAFIQAVREPLEELFRQEPATQVVILVDSLDEALLYDRKPSVVDLLTEAADLPQGVRFILTTRPESGILGALPEHKTSPPYMLSEGEGLTHSQEDVRRHVTEILARDHALLGKFAPELSEQAFAEAVRRKSEGNFLYVRYLLEMLRTNAEPITAQSLVDFPEGLDGIYREFLRRLGGANKTTLEEPYGLVLGALAVAQEALSETQLANFGGIEIGQLRQVRVKLQQLLDVSKGAQRQLLYTIYHRSFADFLLDEERAKGYWRPEKEQHRRIVGYYRNKVTSFKEIDWKLVDDYGLRHLSTHMYAMSEEEAFRRGLYEMVCAPLMQEKQRRYHSYESFVKDVNLAIDMAGSERFSDVTQLARGCLIVATLGSLASGIPTAALDALARLGQVEKAIGHASLILDRRRKMEAYILIGRSLVEKQEFAKAREVLDQILSNAEIEDDQWILSSARRLLTLSLFGDGAIDDAWRSVAQLPRRQDKEKALGDASRVLAQRGDFPQALKVAEKLEEEWQKERALTEIFKAAALARQDGFIKQTLEDFQPGSREEAMREIVEHLVKFDRFDDALRMCEQIGREIDYQRQRLFQIIGVELAASRGSQAVLDSLKTLTSPKDQAAVKAGLCKFLARREPPQEALTLLDEIEREDAESRLREDIAREMAQNGRIAQALSLAATIKEEYQRSRAMGVALCAQTERETPASAVALAATIQNPEERARALEAAAVSFAAGLSADEYKFEESLALVAAIEIEHQEIKETALSKVARRLAAAGEFDKALIIARDLTDDWAKKSLLSEITRRLLEAQKFDRALSVAEEFVADVRKQAETLSEISLALARAGESVRAVTVAERARSLIPQTDSDRSLAGELGDLALTFALSNHPEKAIEIARQAVALSESLIYYGEQEKFHSTLAQVYAAIADFRQAMTFAAKIEDAQARAEVLEEIAYQAIVFGVASVAGEIAEQIWELAAAMDWEERRAEVSGVAAGIKAAIDEIDPTSRISFRFADDRLRANALGQAARFLARVGKFDRAWNLVSAIVINYERWRTACELIRPLVGKKGFNSAWESARTVLNAEDRNHALEQVNWRLIPEGRIDEAVGLAAYFETGPEVNELLENIARNLAEANRFDDALSVIDKLDDDQAKSRVLGEVLSLLAKAENATALWLAWEKKGLGNVDAIGQAADRLAEEGRFNLATQLIERIEDKKARREAVGKVIWGLRQAPVNAEGWDFIAKIENNWDRANAMRLVAESFSEKGDTGEALAIIEKIEEDWCRVQALTNVASDLVKEKKFAEAREVARRTANDREMAEIECLIAQGLIRDGQNDEAGAILEKVIAQLETVIDRAGKDSCLREMCEALTGTGRLDQGQKVAAAIDPRNWLRANELRWIANRLMELNKREQAAQVISQIWASIEQVYQPRDRIWLTGVIAPLAIALDGRAGLKRFLKTVEQFKDSPEDKTQMLSRAALELARWHRRKQAVGPETDPARNWRWIVNRLSEWQARSMVAKLSRQACRQARALGDARSRATVVGQSALALAVAGMKWRASRAAERALAASMTISIPSHQAQALCLAASALNQLNEHAQAVEILDSVLHTAEVISDEQSRFDVFSEMAPVMAETGEIKQIDRAVSLIEMLEEVYQRLRAMKNFAGEMFRVDKRSVAGDVARRAIASIEAENYQEDAFGILAQCVEVVVAARDGKEMDRLLALIDTLTETNRKATILAGAAYALAQANADRTASVTNKAMALIGAIESKSDKVNAYGRLSLALIRTGKQAEGLSMWQEAVKTARLTGRQHVFEAIGLGVETLSAIDRGSTLAQVCDGLLEIESWWGA